MSVAAIYAIRAAEGKGDDLLSMLRGGRDSAGTVEPSEGFEVFQGADDPHKFVMVEHWASIEAHQAHFERNVKASGVLDSAEALMTEPFPPPSESYFVLR
jgi:heme oxygenase (mycobilin-producing)